jgi:hypothetical protein
MQHHGHVRVVRRIGPTLARPRAHKQQRVQVRQKVDRLLKQSAQHVLPALDRHQAALSIGHNGRQLLIGVLASLFFWLLLLWLLLLWLIFIDGVLVAGSCTLAASALASRRRLLLVWFLLLLLVLLLFLLAALALGVVVPRHHRALAVVVEHAHQKRVRLDFVHLFVQVLHLLHVRQPRRQVNLAVGAAAGAQLAHRVVLAQRACQHQCAAHQFASRTAKHVCAWVRVRVRVRVRAVNVDNWLHLTNRPAARGRGARPI